MERVARCWNAQIDRCSCDRAVCTAAAACGPKSPPMWVRAAQDRSTSARATTGPIPITTNCGSAIAADQLASLLFKIQCVNSKICQVFSSFFPPFTERLPTHPLRLLCLYLDRGSRFRLHVYFLSNNGAGYFAVDANFGRLVMWGRIQDIENGAWSQSGVRNVWTTAAAFGPSTTRLGVL